MCLCAKVREQRKQELEQHVQSVNALLSNGHVEGADDDDDGWGEGEGGGEGWQGLDDAVEVGHEDEYVDEDKYTTVTVEAVGYDKSGLLRQQRGDDGDVGPAAGREGGADEAVSADEGSTTRTVAAADAVGGSRDKKRVWTKGRPGGDVDEAKQKKKKKRKKFRYESKADRRATRTKERSRNDAAAKARRG